ncbi:MAG: hypothetical protein ACHREM_26515, partial [Polyangiales bacterium]
MHARSSLFSWLFVAVCSGCDGSHAASAPFADATDEAFGDGSTDTAIDASDALVNDVTIETPAPPVRTLVDVPLFGDTSPGNLLIDPRFEDGAYGYGRWYVFTAKTVQHFTNLVTSDAPDGVAFPVGIFSDATETLNAEAEIVGGPGPFSAQIWVTTKDPTASIAGLFVTVFSASASSGSPSPGGVYELVDVPTSAKTIAGRT